jgi:hypothetical protein
VSFCRAVGGEPASFIEKATEGKVGRVTVPAGVGPLFPLNWVGMVAGPALFQRFFVFFRGFSGNNQQLLL